MVFVSSDVHQDKDEMSNIPVLKTKLIQYIENFKGILFSFNSILVTFFNKKKIPKMRQKIDITRSPFSGYLCSEIRF